MPSSSSQLTTLFQVDFLPCQYFHIWFLDQYKLTTSHIWINKKVPSRMIGHQFLKYVPSLLRLSLLKLTFCVMNFYLNYIVRFQSLIGSSHYLFHWYWVWNLTAWSFKLTCQFQKSYVGFWLSVEFLQCFLSEFNGNLPILLLCQQLHYSEVNQVTNIRFHCLFYCSCKVSKNKFSVQPWCPHSILIFDTLKRINSFLEVKTNISRRCSW